MLCIVGSSKLRCSETKMPGKECVWSWRKSDLSCLILYVHWSHQSNAWVSGESELEEEWAKGEICNQLSCPDCPSSLQSSYTWCRNQFVWSKEEHRLNQEDYVNLVHKWNQVLHQTTRMPYSSSVLRCPLSQKSGSLLFLLYFSNMVKWISPKLLTVFLTT